MNWLKYKQKYFFDGVKNYDEIDKALLFPSDYSKIAELFQKITSKIILSGNYSDENIIQICSDGYNSITDEPLLKPKFINAWTTFNQTLGVGVKKLKKSVGKQNDESLIRQFDINDRPKILTAEEYGLAGCYVISSLEKLGFSFEMATEINRILLEDYSIKLPEKVSSFKVERKKKYVHSSKIKSITIRDDIVSNTKRRRSYIDYIHNYIKNNPMVKNISDLNITIPPRISTKILLQASQPMPEIVPREHRVIEPLQKIQLVLPDSSNISSVIGSELMITEAEANTNNKQNIKFSSSNLNNSGETLLFSRYAAQNRESEKNTNNDVSERCASEQILNFNKLTQIILLASNPSNNTEYRDQLERLNYLEQIPKNKIIHDRFQETHYVVGQDTNNDQSSFHSKSLKELFQTSQSKSTVSQTNCTTISSNRLSNDSIISSSISIVDPK